MIADDDDETDMNAKGGALVEEAKKLNGLGAPLPPECLAACQKENTKPAASIFRLPRFTPVPYLARYRPLRHLPKEIS